MLGLKFMKIHYLIEISLMMDYYQFGHTEGASLNWLRCQPVLRIWGGPTVVHRWPPQLIHLAIDGSPVAVYENYKSWNDQNAWLRLLTSFVLIIQMAVPTLRSNVFPCIVHTIILFNTCQQSCLICMIVARITLSARICQEVIFLSESLKEIHIFSRNLLEFCQICISTQVGYLHAP